jgi:Xaa-Pro dipeptidase
MTNTELYKRHLETLDRYLQDALERSARQGVDAKGVLFHAGRETTYHRDDQPVILHTDPHLRRWAPLEGPENCVLARPGRKPLVIRVVPKDFWLEAPPVPGHYWQSEVDLEEVDSPERIPDLTGSLDGIAFIGASREAAGELGIDEAMIEPEPLLKSLDWYRAYKTEHEVALLDEAAKLGAAGHRVAREMFEKGASEREIHWAYLQASGQLERELPFEAIVALESKIAILHYPHKRGQEAAPGRCFMLDAGASFHGYASDITRTWTLDSADETYHALVQSMDALQRDLVASVAPGRPFGELHSECHRRVALLLAETGIVKTSAEDALERGITRSFLPHGLGHHLGLQVHDVGGKMADPDGNEAPPPDEYPTLRTTRTLEAGHLVTIEPGLYFNEVLLDRLEQEQAAEIVDWKLVDRLSPFGGVRIEDDVLCTENGPEDLTRRYVSGPRDL